MSLSMEMVVEEHEPINNRPVLGLPISPFGANRVRGCESDIDEDGRSVGAEGEATPRALTPSSPRTPRLISPRRIPPPNHHESPGAPPSDRKSSSSSANLLDFPEPPTASPRIYARRASWSSSLLPPSPTPEHRSRVSLDAPRPLLMPPAILRTPSIHSRRLTDDEHTTEDGSFGASPTDSLSTRPTVRSVSAPMTRYGDFIAPTAPSASLNFSYITEPPSKRHSVQFVDRDLRSVPVGLGEGWSGGPQRSAKSTGWFAIKRRPSTSDPLALWGMGPDEDDSQDSDSQRRSTSFPLKQMWNRSLRSLMVTESTPDLHAARSQTPDGRSRRAGSGILKRTSSASRPPASRVSPVTLRQPSLTSQSDMDLSARPRLKSVSSSSTFNSSSPQSRNKISPPPVSILPTERPTSAQAYRLSQHPRSSFARSEGDLLLPLRAANGLPPPWRPQSGNAGTKRLSTLIAEGEEDHTAVEKNASPSLLRSCLYSSPRRSPSRALSPATTFAPEEAAPVMQPDAFNEEDEEYGKNGEDGEDEEETGEQPEMRRVESPVDFKDNRGVDEEVNQKTKPGKRSSFFSKVKAVFSFRRPSASKEAAVTTPSPQKIQPTKRPFSATFSRSRLRLSSPSAFTLNQTAEDPYERARSPWHALQPSRISKRFSAMSGASEVTVRQPSGSETPKLQEEREYRPRPLSVGNCYPSSGSSSNSQSLPRRGTKHHLPSTPQPAQDFNLASVRLESSHIGLEDIIDEDKRGTYVRSLHSSSSLSSAMSMDDLLFGQHSVPRSASMPVGLDFQSSHYPYAPQSGSGTGMARLEERRQSLSNRTTPEQERASVSTGSSHSPVSSHAPVTPALHDSLELTSLDESLVVHEKGKNVEEEGEEDGRNQNRFSAASFASYASLDNEGEIHQGRAVKVDNVLAMQQQASVVSFGELMDRHFGRSGGVKL
ncbi:hypothetical protein IAR50_000788 [Cryptococcus sp. DSM 104548]